MLAYFFVLFAIAVRFMPHPLAFTPVMAALLYFGARGPRRQIWVPLALLAASDVVLTRIVYAYPLTWDHFVTWTWYAAILLLGSQLRENTNWLRVGGAALASSVSFFMVSNFAVWAAWNMYPKTSQRLNDLLCRCACRSSAADSRVTCSSRRSCLDCLQSPPPCPLPQAAWDGSRLVHVWTVLGSVLNPGLSRVPQ